MLRLLARHGFAVVTGLALRLLLLRRLILLVLASPAPALLLLLLEAQGEFVVPLGVGVLGPLKEKGAIGGKSLVERTTAGGTAAQSAAELCEAKIVQRLLSKDRVGARRRALQYLRRRIERIGRQHGRAEVVQRGGAVVAFGNALAPGASGLREFSRLEQCHRIGGRLCA